MKLAPILLFAYNRPSHLKSVLKALSLCENAELSDLYIYHDGLKDENDFEPYIAVKHLIRRNWKFKTVTVVSRDANWGLAENIINGVTEILLKNESVIVLEDDVVPRKGFLRYMNDALTLYKNEEMVGCVHAWNYPMNVFPRNQTTFFLRGADCWGWGTWKRAWSLFERDSRKLLGSIKSKGIEYNFNRNGTIDYVQMLENQILGKNQSWAVRWHASLYLNDKYCLHPTVGIVENIGLDNSGVHCGISRMRQKTTNFIEVKPQQIVESSLYFRTMKTRHSKQSHNTLINRLISNLYGKIVYNIKPIVRRLYRKN